jgi:hypothetical protein
VEGWVEAKTESLICLLDERKCPAMFDVYDCKPQLVVISDDYKQYDTQEKSLSFAFGQRMRAPRKAFGFTSIRSSGETAPRASSRSRACDGDPFLFGHKTGHNGGVQIPGFDVNV